MTPGEAVAFVGRLAAASDRECVEQDALTNWRAEARRMLCTLDEVDEVLSEMDREAAERDALMCEDCGEPQRWDELYQRWLCACANGEM